MEQAERRLFLPDLAATRRLAGRVAALLGPGDVVLLDGDLGAGKSEFARAVIRALAGAPITVPSPTFTILQSYSLPKLEIGHADLYRIADDGEFAEIGLEECWRDGALLVEWPERAPWLWPAERLRVALSVPPGQDAQSRQVELTGTGRWGGLVHSLAADFAPAR
jgi:tRNA threonylcarbamoyl adenosine modification protein YjeE